MLVDDATAEAVPSAIVSGAGEAVVVDLAEPAVDTGGWDAGAGFRIGR